ncbi:hypothetical protein NKY44_26070 [Sinorhizobium meliloti]|uniref:hypothetical protein n=1 Tax=Rhizobium meliloti TaxID=382 RepID=UPI003D65D291
MFRTVGLGEAKFTEPEPGRRDAGDPQAGLSENEVQHELPADTVPPDANTTGIRIDLSGIGERP